MSENRFTLFGNRFKAVTKTNTGGPISSIMPSQRDAADRLPRGGRSVHGGEVANLSSPSSDVPQVTWFDAAGDSVVVDGTPLDGFIPPKGATCSRQALAMPASPPARGMLR